MVVAKELRGDLVVTASAEDTQQECTCVGLKDGGQYTVRQLLHGLLLTSGNDVAHTLARQLGGVPNALRKMNAMAKELGALDTRAVTPSGLDAPGTSTSAYDVGLIFRGAMKYEEFALGHQAAAGAVPRPQRRHDHAAERQPPAHELRGRARRQDRLHRRLPAHLRGRRRTQRPPARRRAAARPADAHARRRPGLEAARLRLRHGPRRRRQARRRRPAAEAERRPDPGQRRRPGRGGHRPAHGPPDADRVRHRRPAHHGRRGLGLLAGLVLFVRSKRAKAARARRQAAQAAQASETPKNDGPSALALGPFSFRTTICGATGGRAAHRPPRRRRASTTAKVRSAPRPRAESPRAAAPSRPRARGSPSRWPSRP